MRVGAKLGLYGLAVVAVFGVAAAVGAALGPIDVGSSPNHGAVPGVVEDEHESHTP